MTVDLSTVAGLEAGTYRLGVIVDLLDEVIEDNENDNTFYWNTPSIDAPSGPAAPNLITKGGTGSYSYEAPYLTINTTVTNNEFLGQTLNVDKIEYKHQVFNNIMNDNVARYYNSSMIEFDGYNTLQIKTVLLSSHPNRIPRVDDIRLAGTTT